METTALAPTLPPIDGLARIDSAVLGTLAARLAGLDYDAGLFARAERAIPGFMRALRLPLLRAWLRREGSPAATLARILAYGEPAPEATVRELLGHEVTFALLEGGLLTARDGDLACGFELLPTAAGVSVLADVLAGGPDAVMGPGPGAELLARLLGDGLRSRSVLDLGCGAGTLALAAAARGARAVATDVNPRALALARFNARLNGVELEVLAGSLFEPVRGRLFDRVVCQPPFVVHPDGVAEATWLHGGRWGDELGLAVAAGAPAALAPGGRFLMLLQSAVREGASFAARLRERLGDAPVDRVVLQTEAPAPALQSMVFAANSDPGLGAGYAEAAAAYFEHFAALGIEEVGGAIVLLSRPGTDACAGGRYSIVTSLEDGDLDHESFERFLAGLEAGALPNERLCECAVRLPRGARLVFEDTGEPGAETAITLRPPPRSVGGSWRMGPDLRAVLMALERADTLAGAARELARASGSAETTVLDELLRFVRAALARGALVAAGGRGVPGDRPGSPPGNPSAGGSVGGS